MNYQDINVLDLIPQRPPMVMISELVLSEERKTITRLHIDEGNIFCEKGFFIEPGLIENIAQTAAARVGSASQDSSQEVKLGFIAAIRDLKIYSLPAVGSVITTEVVVENEVMGFTIISGKIVSAAGEVMAQCEMRIFLSE